MSYAAAKAKHDAEPAVVERRSLWCAAHECPNPWTVDVGRGRLCSAHAYAPSHEWPAITQRLLWDETEQARANSSRQADPIGPPLSREEKVAKLRELQALFRDRRDTATNAPGRGWAHALMERESRGESLTPTQRQMWRDALGPARVHHHDSEETEVPDGPR